MQTHENVIHLGMILRTVCIQKPRYEITVLLFLMVSVWFTQINKEDSNISCLIYRHRLHVQ
jgi:hypothetical protein